MMQSINLLYTKMKIFHFLEKLNSLPIDNKEMLAPLHIRIKPTNVCNHHCYYCAYRTKKMQIGKDMVESNFIPRIKMLELIDDMIKMQVPAVTFSGGGEPFCYPYLLEAVHKLSSSSVKFAALTNGSLLKDEVAEAFAAHAKWVRISIDGWDDDSYSAYRRVSHGEFSKVIANIKNFKKMRKACYLGVSIIVDRKNSAHLYRLIKKLKDCGVDSVKIAPSIASDSRKKNNAYHEKILPVVKKQIYRSTKEFTKNGFEIFDSYHSQLETFEKKYTWCPYLQILPVIGADQNVYSCQDKAYNLDQGLIGSIKNQRFSDFWFSDKHKFFKINPSLNCSHHCVADSKNTLVMEYLNADKRHLCFV